MLFLLLPSLYPIFGRVNSVGGVANAFTERLHFGNMRAIFSCYDNLVKNSMGVIQMRTYKFLFETKSKQWIETIKANNMFEAATKAKNLALMKSKELAGQIYFSFHHVRSV